MLFVAFAVAEVAGQVVRDLPRRREESMEGREFVIGFMQNEIIFRTLTNPERQLVLYIASERGATVRIQYGDWSEFVVTIPAGGIHVERVPDEFMAIRTDRPENKGIFISASTPVVVYGLNTIQYSTDSFMAIPVQHLGTEYIGVSRSNETYDTSATGTDRRSEMSTGIRQGCMMIVAPQSATRVVITPSVDLEGGRPAGMPFDVTLERGQSFFIKSADTNASVFSDLTGTIVQSNLPVAVFSGHVRASAFDNLIPSHKLSKDHLVEQLLPVSKWGTKHATIPFATIPEGDQVRIVPSAWPTVVELYTPGGIQPYTIRNRGDFLEVNLRQVAYWVADNPVSVVQFMRTIRPNDAVSTGDPAMVVVPPIERYSDRALFQVPRLIRQSNAVESDYSYYIIVVAELEAVPSLTLNGASVVALDGNFLMRRVPGVSLCYGYFRVIPGTINTIKCDQGSFSGVMYGVGPADSYANVFGMSFDARKRTEPRTPPQFDLGVVCGAVTGVVRDSVSPSALLDIVSVDRSRTFNYEFDLAGPSAPDRRYRFTATVTNPWQNARIVVQAYDTADAGREWDYTYDAPEFRAPLEMVVTAGITQSCQQFSIVNTDSTPMNIESLSFTGDDRFSTIPQSFRGSVAPGDSLVVTVCFDPPRDPLPAPGRLTLTFACDLVHNIPVRALTSFSLRTEDVDFGTVRLGDTACSSAWIVNNGPNAIRITALDIAQLFPEFTPQISRMALPRDLLPQSRLEVPVCVVPQQVGIIERRDTVRSSPFVGATVGYRVNGVRPDISGVVLRWPDRRVGTTDDSTVILFNRGLADAVLTRSAVTGNAAAFDISAFSAPTLAIDSVSSVVLRVQFVPDVIGEREASIVYVVDWKPHDTVRVVLQGTGTLPTIEGFDANVGSAVIGKSVSLASHTMFAVGGNERLTIDAIAIEGNDKDAFELPQDFFLQQGANPGFQSTIPITFTPRRVGQHTALVRITHDAAPRFERRSTLIQLAGYGLASDGDTVELPPDPIEGDAAFVVPANVVSCESFSGYVVVNGTGTRSRFLETVDATIDGQSVALNGPILPVVVNPGDQLRFTFDHQLRGGVQVPATARVRWQDGGDTLMSRAIVAARTPTQMTVQLPTEHTSGSMVVVEGLTSITSALRDQQSIAFSIEYDVNRLQVNAGSLTVRDQNSNDIVPVTVTPRPNGLRVAANEPMSSPVTLEWQAEAQTFWVSTEPLQVTASFAENDCLLLSTASASSEVINCGGALRMVRLDGGFAVSIPRTVVQHGEEVVIQFQSGSRQVVSIDLINVASRVYPLWENVHLESGQSVVNFAFIDQPSGVYVLRVRYGEEAITVPILVIK